MAASFRITTTSSRILATPSSVLREGHTGVRGDKKPHRFCLEDRRRACANVRVILHAAFARPPSGCDPCSFRPPQLHCCCADGLASQVCSCIVRLCVRKRQGRVRQWRAWNVETWFKHVPGSLNGYNLGTGDEQRWSISARISHERPQRQAVGWRTVYPALWL